MNALRNINLHLCDNGHGDLPRMGYHSAGRPGARKPAANTDALQS